MSVIDPIEGMPKKRRKLNKDMEAEMAAAKRKIELVGALINDIRNEDIQAEYLGAFTQIRSAVVNLIAKYTTDGFCEETGEAIGIKRLEARPIATLSIEAQERHEKLEKTQID